MSGATNNPYLETIIKCGIPDYSSVKSLGTVGTFTAESNGFIQLFCNTGGNTASIFHRIFVNGCPVDQGYTLSKSYNYYTSPLIPVMKGDTFQTVGNTEGVTYETRFFAERT